MPLDKDKLKDLDKDKLKAKLPQIRAKLSQRLRKKGNAPILKWIKPDLTRSEAFSDTVYVALLDMDTEIGTPEYNKVEEEITDRGGKILEKHSDRFEDTIIIDVSDLVDSLGAMEYLRQINGIMAVYPRPIPKSLVMTGNGEDGAVVKVGKVCTATQAKKQAAIIDQLISPRSDISNKGKGAHIVIWDFLPEDREAFKNSPDMKDRPGGPPEIYDDETAATDMHGGAVASTACGAGVGLATESQLSVIGITSSVTGDLSIIDEICAETNGPVIVNMSFALEFKGITEAGDKEDTKESIGILTEAVQFLRDKYDNLVFIVAAGNENLNACDSEDPVSFTGCDNCYMWPQSQFGGPYDYMEIPYVFVGATDAAKINNGKRERAVFSNYGKCVHAYTNGTPVCALDTTEKNEYVAIAGTSFASPLFASLMALYFTAFPGKTNNEATAYLIENAQKGTITFDSASSDSNNTFAIVTKDMEKASSSAGIAGGETEGILDTIEDGPVQDGKWNKRFFLIMFVIVCIVAVCLYYYEKQKKKKKRLRRYGQMQAYRSMQQSGKKGNKKKIKPAPRPLNKPMY